MTEASVKWCYKMASSSARWQCQKFEVPSFLVCSSSFISFVLVLLQLRLCCCPSQIHQQFCLSHCHNCAHISCVKLIAPICSKQPTDARARCAPVSCCANDGWCCDTVMTMARFHPWFNPRIGVVSRVLDQKLMCAPMEKTHDLIRNTKWNRNDEFPRRVLSRCCKSYGHVVTRVPHHDESMRAVQRILPTKMPILLDCRSNMGLFLW